MVGEESLMNRIINAVLAVCLLSLPALSQSQMGRIFGIVTDSSGAIIPGVVVVVTNTATNQSKSFMSDDRGRFMMPDLQPAEYQISVEVPGFKKFVRPGVIVRVNDSLEIPLMLEVGLPTETVTVSAATPLMNTTSSALGEVVENKMVLDLPLNGRQTLSLVTLVPGVVPNRQMESTSQNFNRAGNFSVGGARGDTNELLLDGVPNTLPEGSTGAMTAVAVFPSVDSTQEFKVQSNAYSAEYGRTGGGVINIVTKSGSNDIHGSLYEFMRNSVLDANNFFNNKNNLARSSFKRNQFGGTVGGPIYIPKLYNGKNKTFFFFSFEQLIERPSLTNTRTVPTARELAGDFSQTFNSAGKLVTIYDPLTTKFDPVTKTYTRQPFLNNIIPSNRFDPIMQKALKTYPLPNREGDANTHTNNYVKSLTRIINDYKIDTRLDHQISSKQNLLFRVSFGDRTYTNNCTFCTVGESIMSLPSWYRSIAVGDTWSVTSKWLLDIKYSYNYLGFLQQLDTAGYNLTQLGFPQSMQDYAVRQVPEFPGFTFTGYTGYGDGQYMWSYQEGHNGMVSLMRIGGNHLIKIGTDNRMGRMNRISIYYGSGGFNFTRGFTQGPNALTASTSAGNAIAEALMGYVSSGSQDYAANPARQSWYNGLYFQDDWKVSSKLTLNLGLRYDQERPEKERFNHISWFDPTLSSPIAAQVPSLNLKGAIAYASEDMRSPYFVDRNNFAPRVGLAFKASDNMVVRTGYGFFYAPMTYGLGSSMGSGWSASTPFVASVDGVTPTGKLSDPFPTGYVLPLGPQKRPDVNIGQGVSMPDRYSRTPYIQQWNLNIQRRFGTSVAVDIAYSGAKATHLQDATYNLMQFRADQLSPDLNVNVPNPFYGVITIGSLANPTVPKSQLMKTYPQYTGVTLDRPAGSASIFHSFQLKVNKRFSKGFSFLTSYTKGKLIDDNSGMSSWLEPSSPHQDVWNRRLDRAVGDQDVAQRLATSFNTSLPFGKKGKWGKNWSRFVDGFLGGWQANGILIFQSGIPLPISTTNTSYSGNSALRPNNNGQSARLEGGASSRMDKFFKTEVFSAPALYTFGTVGRNLPDVRGPGVNNLDFSIFKNIPFAEGRFFQFRAEAFNVTNTPEFNNPDTGLQSATFGKITSQRNIPRQIQFGLKIIF